ncbi:MAG: hypothetical protein M3256_19080 [Actinomycetota bacterium]|nr:hypothetical protein [Actinomycetota bacterium]
MSQAAFHGRSGLGSLVGVIGDVLAVTDADLDIKCGRQAVLYFVNVPHRS